MSVTLLHARFLALAFVMLTLSGSQAQTPSNVTPDMIFNLSGLGNAWMLFDGDPNTAFIPKHFQGFQVAHAPIILRMNPQTACAVTKINFTPTLNKSGTIRVYIGEPGPNGWTAVNASAQPYGGSTLSTLEWHVNASDVDFVRFVFEEIPGQSATFGTGELTLTTSGACSFYDQAQAASRQSAVTFDNFMGVNHFVGKTALTEFFGPFKNVREFLPWDHVQGHSNANTSSPFGEDHDFHFSPCYPGYDLDRHYSNLNDMGKKLLGDFKESAPFQMFFDYDSPNAPNGTAATLGLNYGTMGGEYLELMERKPGHPADGVQPNSRGFSDPTTYKDHAEALYQTSLRYGQGGDENRARFSDTNMRANQGSFSWIENWNEQDKWWNLPAGPAPVNSIKEQRLSYFTPEEYMAMSYADANLAEGPLTVPLVMSGLSELDETYLRGMWMAWWELTGTDPAQTFPFHALNFHHYSLNAGWTQCVMPEADWFFDGHDAQSPLARIFNFTEKYLPGREIWLTEFGYSDHPGDNTSATPNYANPDNEEVQAQWLMRAFLRLYRFGFDRAFTYQLTDDGPNMWSGMFNHTGMIDRSDTGGWLPEYRMKKSWFYLYTLRQTLQNAEFLTERSYIATDGRPVKDYMFLDENNEKIHVLWIPQANSPTTVSIPLNVALSTKLEIIRPESGSITGKSEFDVDADGNGYVDISGIGETPIFVKEGAPIKTAGCSTYVPLLYQSGDQTAATLITDETLQMAQEGVLPRCTYGKNAMTRWEYGAGSVTLDIGLPGMSDTWDIEGIYIQDPTGQEGIVHIELLDANGFVLAAYNYKLDGQAVFPYTNYGTYHVWKRFEDIDVTASAVRVTKSANAALGELVISAKTSETCSGDGQNPNPASQGTALVSATKVDFAWTLPNVSQDANLIDVVLYDSIAQQVVKATLPISMAYSYDVSGLPCGASYTASVRVRDCEGLYAQAVIIPFATVACAPPPPPPTNACVCTPQPLTLPANQTYYEFNGNQAVPPTNNPFFDACFDQASDKMPFRLMDEQGVASVNLLCSASYNSTTGSSDFYTCQDAETNGFPVNEWFPGWSANEYPYRAVLDFAGLQTFNGIYIYDGNDQGDFAIAYRPVGSQSWETLELGPNKSKIMQTDQWRTWRLVYFDAIPVQAEAIRVTMFSPQARISEIMLCSAAPIKKGVWSVAQKPKRPTKGGWGSTIESGNRADLPSPVEKHVMKNGMSIFPNPAIDVVHVETISHAFTDVRLDDAFGRPVWKAENLDDDSLKLDFSVKNLPPGVYFLQAQREGRVLVREEVVVIDY